MNDVVYLMPIGHDFLREYCLFAPGANKHYSRKKSFYYHYCQHDNNTFNEVNIFNNTSTSSQRKLYTILLRTISYCGPKRGPQP